MFYHLEKYEECIADCERAMQVDPAFTKVSKLASEPPSLEIRSSEGDSSVC